MAVLSKLSKLEEIEDLRTVWPHEAQDFTPWLAKEENIEILSDAIGIDISVDETESPVGSFSLDMLASEVGTDRKIIIENQLEDTNHDHLGKLITYASGKSADIIIWLVKHAREEHKAAIEWLNNHTDDEIGFFLCEIKLYKIGNSDPAVKFEVVEKPNGWQKVVKKEFSANSTEQKRYDYWVAFLDYAFKNKEFSSNFSRRSPSPRQWLTFALGSSTVSMGIGQLLSKNELVIQIYIYDDEEQYNKLLDKKREIEGACGFSLEWHERPNQKSNVLEVRRSANLSDKNEWNDQFGWIMDKLLKIKKAINPCI